MGPCERRSGCWCDLLVLLAVISDMVTIRNTWRWSVSQETEEIDLLSLMRESHSGVSPAQRLSRPSLIYHLQGDPAPLVSTELSLDPAFYSVHSVQTMHTHKFLGGPWANGIVPVLIASCPATHRKAILQKCRTVKLLSGLGRCNCTREFMASRRGPHSK